jgi:hypothetical protein
MDVTEDLSFLGYRIGQQYSYKDGFYGGVGRFGGGIKIQRLFTTEPVQKSKPNLD